MVSVLLVFVVLEPAASKTRPNFSPFHLVWPGMIFHDIPWYSTSCMNTDAIGINWAYYIIWYHIIPFLNFIWAWGSNRKTRSTRHHSPKFWGCALSALPSNCLGRGLYPEVLRCTGGLAVDAGCEQNYIYSYQLGGYGWLRYIMDPALDSPLLILLCIIIILLLLILSIPVDTKASQPVKAIYSSHTTATNCQQSPVQPFPWAGASACWIQRGPGEWGEPTLGHS